MKLAIIGATGRVGSRILSEALTRGHEVTAIARHVEELAPRPHLVAKPAMLPIRGHSRPGSRAMMRSSAPCGSQAPIRAS